MHWTSRQNDPAEVAAIAAHLDEFTAMRLKYLAEYAAGTRLTAAERDAELRRLELALGRELAMLDARSRRFVIQEEPEFIWKDGSNFEP